MFNTLDHTIIIAEAGVNHNGSLDQAKELVCVAKQAGADYVKFQSFNPANLVSPKAQLAKYQAADSEAKTQFDMLSELILTTEEFHELSAYCKEQDIPFISTPFDPESVDFLDALDVPFFKVSSGDITNRPLLERMIATGRPVILSSGNSTMAEVEAVVKLFTDRGYTNENLAVLHCTSEYPAPFEDLNLRAMHAITETTGMTSGLSDHSPGVEAAVAAVAIGARIVEKHFTTDKSLPGPDHKASLDPQELQRLVAEVRHVEQALGTGEKAPKTSERKNLDIIRRSIHYKRELKTGHVIQMEDLVMLRPGNGISPMDYDTVIGKTLTVEVAAYDMLKQEHLA